MSVYRKNRIRNVCAYGSFCVKRVSENGGCVTEMLEKERKLLERYGLVPEDIVYTARFDVAEYYRFTDGMLLLTAEKLAVLLYPPVSGKDYYFGGYRTNPEEAGWEPTLQIYDLAEVESLGIIRELTGGVLFGKIGGVETRLCRFTNSHMGEMERLTGNLEKVKKKETLTKEDIEGKQRIERCPKCGTIYPDQQRRICPKCMDRKSIFARLASYFLKFKGRLVVMALCFVGTAVLNLVYPYLSGTVLYDKVLSRNTEFMEFLQIPGMKFGVLLLVVVVTMAVSKILMQLLGIIHGTITATIVPDVVAKIKQEVFQSMGKLSISFYNSRQTGGLMTRVLDDAGEITSFFIDGVPYFFSNALTIIVTAVIMIRLNWQLAVIALILLPVLTFTSYKMMPRLWHMYGRRHRANRSLNSQMNDNITGARVVKAFGQEEQEMSRFHHRNDNVRKAELDVAKYEIRFYSVLYSLVENLTSFMVWGLGAILILNDSGLEFGVLITITGYVTQLQGPLDFMSRVFRWWTNSMNSAQRIFEIIDAQPEVAERLDPVRPEKIRGEIEMRHVTFGYEKHKPVLKDVSFHIEAGKVLGIVGRSGAGKSTLVNLISRLYDVQEGEIYIDGINVRDMGFRELRKNIAMVSQETYIFMGTAAENIAYARPDATRAEIIAAAKQASAHDFICKMPDGYDTVIGSSGRTLSGGEKQRISIARAILADPRILILDEATAAVDTETELAIQESLEKLVKGRTTLSIAHRLSTLRNADRLIVIDDGKITEQGTHQELADLKGTYFKLMELQTKALALRE